jgi:hypothetical protein
MIRFLWFTPLLLVLSALIAVADEKKPNPEDEVSTVQVELRGKLVRDNGIYCVKARNEGGTTFLVQLVRSEDKNQELDKYLEGLVDSVVAVRGTLRFSPGRIDGPQLGIHLKDKSQINKAK